MLSLKKRNVTPPGGFHYEDPDTGQTFKAVSLTLVIKQAAQHRLVNKLTVPATFPQIIEDWLCQKMPKGVCVDSESGRPVGRAPRDAYTALKGTYALRLITKKGQHGYVGRKVAEKRAAICAGCSSNKATGGCTGCRGIKSIIRNAKRGRRTTLDSKLHVCTIAGVYNAVHVHFDNKTLLAGTPPGLKGAFPPNCWRAAIKGGR